MFASLQDTPPGSVTLAMAGLLTCGSMLSRTFPGVCPVVFVGVAHRSQLRGQSRIWRLLSTPHRVPISSRRLVCRQEPSPSVRAFGGKWSMISLRRTEPLSFWPRSLADQAVSETFWLDIILSAIGVAVRIQDERHRKKAEPIKIDTGCSS